MNYHVTIELSGSNLDMVLAHGWYRGGNHVFTADFIYYDQNVEPGNYPVFWLRYDMRRLVFSKTMQRLERASAQFELGFQPFELTDEFEELYFRHMLGAKFYGSPSLSDYLNGDFGHTGVKQFCIFDSRAVTIRHQGKLIAAGITDMGEKAMSGIANFFDPTMRKYSLGKMLVVLKLLKAREKQMDWFYPGYIAPGIPAFDYKTFVGTDFIEVWDSFREVWIPFHDFQFTNRY